MLNYVCNCSCVFCPATGLQPPFKRLDEIRAGIDRAASACSREQIEFSGGEILLHPDLPDAVQYAKIKGFRRVHFFTNGILFSDLRVCKRYTDLGLDSVMVSIHGATEETHEGLMRAPSGSYRAVWKAIDNLQMLGVGVTVNCVVTGLNIAEIPQLMEQCAMAYPSINQLRITYPAVEGEIVTRQELLVPFEEALEVLTPLSRCPESLNLRFELFPFCVLGSLTNLSVEWLSRHQTSYFEEFCSLRYRRVLGKECVECPHKTTCHGIQEEYIRRFGAPTCFCKNGDRTGSARSHI